ncbi:MAG: lamin tail domain-containing protein [Sandaracinaceae bacterium]|nr:lamin tail domain-containing protein [Sandaracinaceae bacterium]
MMANPLDEDTGELIEIYNRGIDPIDVDGLLISDGDATDRITGFGGGTTVIPAGGYGVILDAEYAGEYAIPPEAILLTTADTTIGSGLAIDDPIRLLESNGVEVIDTFRFPFNPGNGVSAERIDVRAFDSASNWTASTCASGSSPGADNCAASPTGLPKRVRITEVLSNQTGVETGGAGGTSRSSTRATSPWTSRACTSRSARWAARSRATASWPTPAGARCWCPARTRSSSIPTTTIASPSPAGTVVVTISDTNFGSAGIATTHGVTLYDADGITALDAFRHPSDPGDGVSLYRISLVVADSAANWAATPCGSTPGRASCPSSADVTSYTSFWIDRDGSEGGHYWHQAIGWPVHGGDCELLIVCTGGLYGYDYRDNVPAPASFSFTNPYPDRPIVFEERSSPTDRCMDPCPNATFTVDPGATRTVPASSLGWYFVVSGGPTLNAFDWWGGDPDRYWALPPDGVLAPFSVEVVLP